MAAAGRAIVIGAGLAGLGAARALSDHFARVIVLDRDALEQGPSPRRCVPQGQHVHLLLAKGLEVLNRMFPRLTDELVASGAAHFDIGPELEYWRRGQRKMPFPAGLETVAVSRPALEWAARKRVALLPRVELHGHCTVERLRVEHGRVSGVQLASGTHYSADLVIDAAGRGSRLRRWLEELAYPIPRSSEIKIGLGYASRFVLLSEREVANWKMLYVAPSANSWTRGGALMKVEGQRALLTLAGYLGEHPPSDDQGFLRFAYSLGCAFTNALRGATFQGPTQRFSAGTMLRHHFEDVRKHPPGLLGIGDAICLLDPSFGQGMTIALLEAQLLGNLLRSGHFSDLQTEFYRGAKPIVDLAWTATAAENFRRPGMTGDRPALLRAVQWYSAQAMELADTDPTVHRALQESLHLTAGPLSLLRPALLSRVLGHAARSRG